MGKLFFIIILIILLIPLFLTASPVQGGAASLYLAPSKGTFLVGSTFSVSIYVDTKGNKINALRIDLKFPPDILQVTLPTGGESFISDWLTPPNYSNIGGFVNFKGGIPEGIVTSAGLVSTVTFRARSSGIAKIEILDSSKIVLADGKGTLIPTINSGGIYEILTPPPEGPKIFSLSHPDQDKWYADANPVFFWEKEGGVTDFSYGFSQNSQENPDTISEGNETFKSYENIQDGTWHFHLRAKKNGIWGKTSHFMIKTDNAPPKEFKPKVDTSRGSIYFETKDIHSGIDHYEISLININESPTGVPFFVEATSPFKFSRAAGNYNVVLIAYDRAGNYQMAETQFQILSSIISVEKDGFRLGGFFISLLLFVIISFVFISGMGFLIFYVFRPKIKFKKGIKEIKEALEEIRKIEKEEMDVSELKKKFEIEKEELEKKLKH